jgi:hypothetical protein
VASRDSLEKYVFQKVIKSEKDNKSECALQQSFFLACEESYEGRSIHEEAEKETSPAFSSYSGLLETRNFSPLSSA